MSLINEVLRDAAQRRVQDATPASQAASFRSQAASSRSQPASLRSQASSLRSQASSFLSQASSSSWGWLPVGIALGALVTGASLSFVTVPPSPPPDVSTPPPAAAFLAPVSAIPLPAKSRSQPAPLAKLASSASSSNANTDSKTESAWPSGTALEVWLDGMYIQSAGEATRLVLLLDGPAHYWIEGDLELGQIEIVLPNTRLSQVSSPLALSGTPIRSIETHGSELGLHVRLETRSLAGLQSQLIERDGKTSLVLDLTPRRRVRTAQLPRIDEAVQAAVKTVVEPVVDSVLDTVGETADSSGVLEITRRRRQGGAAETAYRDGIAHYRAGRSAAAQAKFEHALSLKPGHTGSLVALARALASQSKLRQAVQVLEAEGMSASEAPTAHALLAALHQQLGNHHRAAELYRTVAREQPSKSSLWLGLAISLEATGRPARALSIYLIARSGGTLGEPSQQWAESRITALRRQLAAPDAG